jgi:ankyrin repeat protein
MLNPSTGVTQIFHTTPQHHDYNNFIIEYADLLPLSNSPQLSNKFRLFVQKSIEKVLNTYTQNQEQGVKCLTTCNIGRLEDAALAFKKGKATSADYLCKFIEYLPTDAPYDAIIRLGQMLTLKHHAINIQNAPKNSHLKKFLDKTHNGQRCLDIADPLDPRDPDQKKRLMSNLINLQFFQNMMTGAISISENNIAASWVNTQQVNLLHELAKNGTLTKDIIDANIDFIDATDQQGKTALYLAVENEQFDCVKILLKKGANMNIPDLNKNSPLHIAAQKKSLDIPRLLIASGSKINAQNAQGKIPEDLAQNNPKMFEILRINILLVDNIKKGLTQNVKNFLHSEDAYLTILDIDGNNFVMMAASSNNDTNLTIKFLVEKGIDVNALNEINGKTALSLAVESGFQDKVKTLLDLGANMHMQDADGNSVLDLTKDPNMLTFLKTNLDLLTAVQQNNTQNALQALQNGATPNIQDEKGSTALDIAIGNKNLQLIRLIMKFKS